MLLLNEIENFYRTIFDFERNCEILTVNLLILDDIVKFSSVKYSCYTVAVPQSPE